MNNPIKLFLILVASQLIISCGTKDYSDPMAFVDEVKNKVTSIEPQIVKNMLDTGAMILLIDVREGNEFNFGYIPGAINIPRGVLEFRINNQEYWDAQFLYVPLKEDFIIINCKKGKRSILAAYQLIKMGFTNVKYLEGGWKAWETAYPDLYEKNLQMHVEEKEEEGGC